MAHNMRRYDPATPQPALDLIMALERDKSLYDDMRARPILAEGNSIRVVGHSNWSISISNSGSISGGGGGGRKSLTDIAVLAFRVRVPAQFSVCVR